MTAPDTTRSFADELFGTVRDATRALYPQARIPEGPMPATTTAGRIEELAKLLARECPLGQLLLAVAKTEDGGDSRPKRR